MKKGAEPYGDESGQQKQLASWEPETGPASTEPQRRRMAKWQKEHQTASRRALQRKQQPRRKKHAW